MHEKPRIWTLLLPVLLSCCCCAGRILYLMLEIPWTCCQTLVHVRENPEFCLLLAKFTVPLATANRNISRVLLMLCVLVKWVEYYNCHFVDLCWPLVHAFCSCFTNCFLQFPQFISHSIFTQKLWNFLHMITNESRF